MYALCIVIKEYYNNAKKAYIVIYVFIQNIIVYIFCVYASIYMEQ